MEDEFSTSRSEQLESDHHSFYKISLFDREYQARVPYFLRVFWLNMKIQFVSIQVPEVRTVVSTCPLTWLTFVYST
ncbi:hypothetical protein SAMN02745866_01033 [Alteromonadaceae bacterium Bs31]|nr:hypothetical protein SAMN02745866_01033 [Alteromonadaceae bacterium Bs31]